jgi:exodeoxyribonuclease VII small subunit
MADDNATPAPDFESALDRLEHIVKTLEEGSLALDNSLELFEEGIRLSRFCHGKLEQAERRVEILLKSDADTDSDSNAGETGDIKTIPFEAEPDR